MNNLQPIRDVINRSQKILIFMHSNPDIDCIGAAYALFLYFSKNNKFCRIAVEKKIYNRYLFFVSPQHHDIFITGKSFRTDDYDCMIAVDSSDLKRLGDFSDIFYGFSNTAVIDHHYSFEPFGKINFNAPRCSSTCEIVYDLLTLDGINDEIALALYAGIIFDTGGLRYSTVNGALLRKVADILDRHKLDTNSVYFNIFENESLLRKKLISRVIESIESHANGEVVISFLTSKTLAELKVTEEDAQDLVHIGNSTEGCKFSVFIKDRDDGIHLSFRTSTEFNVSDLAKTWGGGGHKKASGVTIKNETFDTIKQRYLPLIINKYEEWRKNNAL